MSETKPSSTVDSTCDFTKRLKSSRSAERIVSLSQREHERILRLSAWSHRWVLSVRVDAKHKRVDVRAATTTRYMARRGTTFVLYRRRMLQLLRWPKPAFDQLAIELPTLMGFRAKEVTTWRAEWIDFVNGETLVLDAKKERIYPVPLNTQAARHAEEVLNGRSEGLVLRSRSNRQQDPNKPLTPTAVWYIWKKWTSLAGFEPATSVSPVVGRRYFAHEFYHSQPENLVELQVIMRHSDPGITLDYVRSLVSWEDVKEAYDRFQLRLRQEEPVIA